MDLGLIVLAVVIVGIALAARGGVFDFFRFNHYMCAHCGKYFTGKHIERHTIDCGNAKAQKANLAGRLFDEQFVAEKDEEELTQRLRNAGMNFERLGWDHYDCSVELHEVPPDFRLTPEMQRVIHEVGFAIAYLNHTDKWETHYSSHPMKEFQPSKGWRVSYPQKRGPKEKGIWVEEVITTWPSEWFTSGYAVIKKPKVNT